MKWRGARLKTAFEWFEVRSLEKDIGDTNLKKKCKQIWKRTNTNKFV